MTVKLETQPRLLSLLIRVLVLLTSQYRRSFNTFEEEESIESYNEYLAKVKDLFTEPLSTWPLIKYLKTYSSQTKEGVSEVSQEEARECITLVKKLLEIRDYEPTTSAAALIAHLQK